MEQNLAFKNWDKKNVRGTWDISTKIDGVFARIKNGNAVSKAGKPLYNLAHFPDGVYEIFVNDWNDTISHVRTQSYKKILLSQGFTLHKPDTRLHLCTKENPDKDFILDLLKQEVSKGHEGLILRQGLSCIKVKKNYTVDIAIYGIKPGEGRNFGKVGAFLTRKGRVGTGLSDKQREEYKNLPAGTIIEVSYFELTKNGLFRHPKFIRVRFDK